MSDLEPIVIDPRTFLYEHCTLPALPEVVSQIQEEIVSPDISTEKISTLIGTDPAIVAHVLKIVNSAYFSLPVEISDVKMAVSYIGIAEVYRLILSISVINTLSANPKKEYRIVWSHSLLTAFCAKYFAQKFAPKLNLNELWTGALLHDIGKMIYLKFFPDHYNTLVKYRCEKGCLFCEAEKQHAFPSSSYLGTLLCDRWILPEKIKKACSIHSLHNLKKMNEEGTNDPYIKMIILGNLAAVLSEENLSQEKKEEIVETMLTTLNIDTSNFISIMAEISQQKNEANRLLSQLK